jgi:hypothetical protein
MHKIFVLQKVYFMPLHVSNTRAHHQEVKIALHSLWYHHTYRWCDDTRGFIMQFWPPDDEHMCSKHVEARNKLIVKQKCCASSWLITEINILRYTVSKTSKFVQFTVPSGTQASPLLVLGHKFFAIFSFQTCLAFALLFLSVSRSHFHSIILA